MAPRMRIPTVEFRSLLLPPVRIPIRALHTLYRPQCAPHVPRPACPTQRLEQRRALNLYKTAKAKTVLGQHKVLNFSSWEIEILAPLQSVKHRVKLWQTDKKAKKLSVIAKSASFEELLTQHVGPGKMLYCLGEITKGMASRHIDDPELPIPEELRDFAIHNAYTYRAPKTAGQKGKQIGGLKNIILNESSPVEYFRMCLDRAYQFIEAGHAVEFRLRLQGKMLLKEERIKPAGPERWLWMHTHFPHLRPEIIMKSMPEDTRYLINPVSDGRLVQWVAVAGNKVEPAINLDNRLFHIKSSVTSSIKSGNQAMLPKVMRQQLRNSGLEDYSINTGLPRKQARAKHGKGGKRVLSGEEKKYLKRDEETDGFLVPDPDAVLPIRRLDDLRDPRGGTQRWQQRGQIGNKNSPKF
ncbi:hypothetical protein J4E90_008433 [Alternaria incomplexa]|uniref:uncharacterized protein n=1 Tax=Alternaria incomplexa TaxID=1187928 RepID=UPI00221FE07F|nr:uncharacterized protein J4E90_008433 [Alternaria incomplexa]KAI4908701.1 hypothetical protein J4E90_008433 [Alternaria incomplexa]